MYALVIEKNDWDKSAEEARDRRMAEKPDNEYFVMSQEDEEEQMVWSLGFKGWNMGN